MGEPYAISGTCGNGSLKHPWPEQGARIPVLTDDPHGERLIVPSCHLIPCAEKRTYYFQDCNALVGMVVSTVHG